MRCGRWLTVLVVVALLAGMARCMSGLVGHRPPHFSGGEGVALIRLDGEIMDVDDLLREIHEAMIDDHVRAVVLRVNSPGGSVGASQELYLALKALRAKKPLIASFGTVAASGGYYAGMAAAPIFTLPGTLTGSIGVRMMHVDASGLIQWAMVHPQTLKSGARKDVGDPIRPLTDDERQFLQGRLDAMHEQFMAHVAEARQQPLADIRAVADGRVLTGDEAIAAHLADRVGTLYDAIAEAGRQAHLGDEPEILEFDRGGQWFDRFSSVGARLLQRWGTQLQAALSGSGVPAARLTLP